MKEINVIGLDLAKNIFYVYGVNRQGQPVVSRQFRRKQLLGYFAQLPPCRVGMEACATSHYWARELARLGHEVKLMAPGFVRPYVKSNKNDQRDAEAICEAVQRPGMRFVAIKTPEQQAVSHLHRSRQLLVKERVSISNHIRGLLAEFGIVMAVGVKSFERQVPLLLDDEQAEIPALSRDSLRVMWSAYVAQQARIKELEQALVRWHREHEASRRLAEVPGIGVHTATALVAKLGNARTFRHGREVAAFIGLVPKQASSGGKVKLLGISKRGDLPAAGRYDAQTSTGARGTVGNPSCPASATGRLAGGPALGRDVAGAQTPQPGGNCPGQQNGPHRLGHPGA